MGEAPFLCFDTFCISCADRREYTLFCAPTYFLHFLRRPTGVHAFLCADILFAFPAQTDGSRRFLCADRLFLFLPMPAGDRLPDRRAIWTMFDFLRHKRTRFFVAGVGYSGRRFDRLRASTVLFSERNPRTAEAISLKDTPNSTSSASILFYKGTRAQLSRFHSKILRTLHRLFFAEAARRTSGRRPTFPHNPHKKTDTHSSIRSKLDAATT